MNNSYGLDLNILRGQRELEAAKRLIVICNQARGIDRRVMLHNSITHRHEHSFHQLMHVLLSTTLGNLYFFSIEL